MCLEVDGRIASEWSLAGSYLKADSTVKKTAFECIFVVRVHSRSGSIRFFRSGNLRRPQAVSLQLELRSREIPEISTCKCRSVAGGKIVAPTSPESMQTQKASWNGKQK
jgi:hypothetical protein